MFRRRPSKKQRPVPPINEQVCARFKVPVCNLNFHVQCLDRTVRPWSFRAVQN